MTSWQYRLDRTGMWTSALCAVHCIAVPVLISMSAFGSLAFLHNDHMENVVLAISASVAVSSLIPSYIKHHRKVLPIAILLLGFSLIAMSRLLVESVMSSLGAALVATAHFSNFRYCKKTPTSMNTLFTMLLTASVLTQSSANSWDIFAKVKFTPQLVKEVNGYLLIPF